MLQLQQAGFIHQPEAVRNFKFEQRHAPLHGQGVRPGIDEVNGCVGPFAAIDLEGLAVVIGPESLMHGIFVQRGLINRVGSEDHPVKLALRISAPIGELLRQIAG